jgi:hypothetical protein
MTIWTEGGIRTGGLKGVFPFHGVTVAKRRLPAEAMAKEGSEFFPTPEGRRREGASKS